MTTASDILKKARAEIGYKESPKNSNRTKYGAWFGLNGQPWCAIFLCWCFHNSGGKKLFPKNANAAYAQDEIVSKCGGSWIMKKTTSASKRKAVRQSVKPGDVATFDFGAFDAFRRHIGIVESVAEGGYYCIEGNTSKAGSQSNGGQVCRKFRSCADVCAIARPAYDKEEPKLYGGKLPTKTIKKGSKGEQVKLWQAFLNWAGYRDASGSRLAVDGDFGAKTEQAQKKWQKAQGFRQTGIVGADSRRRAAKVKR